MPWGANFATAIELTREFINIMLDKFLQVLRAQNQHVYNASLGFFGNINAELSAMEVQDLHDPGVPGGGVLTDFQARGSFRFRLFNLLNISSIILLVVEDVSIDFTATPSGIPKGIVIAISPGFRIRISFPGAGGIGGFILNRLIGPLVSFGVWLSFRLIRKVEIPVWDLVDIFAVLGLRFSPGSPLLTAQQNTLPHSLLLASSFNLTDPPTGIPNQLQSFIPVSTNVGAAIHERLVAAGVQVAIAKGWVPNQFNVNGWRININSISIQFEQDKIVASGRLKAKRGSCWCRVKVKIDFNAAIKPSITNTAGPNPKPTVEFIYDADINVHISTSGMLVVLAAIMLAPLFMSLTIAMSVLINLVLDQFLPFTTSFQLQGGRITATLKAANVSGIIPFSLSFPLQLSGQGSFDISRFQQFTMPGGVPASVRFTNESLAVQPDELRVAVGIS